MEGFVYIYRHVPYGSGLLAFFADSSKVPYAPNLNDDTSW